MELRLTQQMKCSCCKQPISPEKQEKQLVDISLFGARKYAVCPLCQQIVGKPWVKVYKNRVDKILAKRK